jgi:hypothetical protein
MRRLVQADGKQQHNNLKNDQNCVYIHALLPMV